MTHVLQLSLKLLWCVQTETLKRLKHNDIQVYILHVKAVGLVDNLLTTNNITFIIGRGHYDQIILKKRKIGIFIERTIVGVNHAHGAWGIHPNE
jgi:hypothetical protein